MSYAQATTILSNFTKVIYDDLNNQSGTGAGSLLGNITTAINAHDNMANGSLKAAVNTACQSLRSSAANRRAIYRAILDPVLVNIGYEINSSAIRGGQITNYARFFRDWRDYQDDVGLYSGGSTDEKVTAKAVTYASDPADSATGIFRRLTVDCRAQKIESGRAYSTKTIRVDKTSAAGAQRRRATASIIGANGPVDFLENDGSDSAGTLECISDANPGSLLAQPLLPKTGATTAGTTVGLTAVSGWTGTDEAGSPTVVTTTTSTYLYGDLTYSYKYTGAGTTRRWTANTPAFSNLDPYTPISIMVPVYMEASWQGTVTLVVGGTTFLSVAHGSMSAGWNYLTPTINQTLYAINFAAAANLTTYVQIATGAGAGSNAIYARPVFIVPMTRNPQLDSAWYSWFMRADDTPDLHASVSYADSTSIGGKYQYVLDKVYNNNGEEPEAYLCTTGTNSLADPS